MCAPDKRRRVQVKIRQARAGKVNRWRLHGKLVDGIACHIPFTVLCSLAADWAALPSVVSWVSVQNVASCDEAVARSGEVETGPLLMGMGVGARVHKRV